MILAKLKIDSIGSKKHSIKKLIIEPQKKSIAQIVDAFL